MTIAKTELQIESEKSLDRLKKALNAGKNERDILKEVFGQGFRDFVDKSESKQKKW